MGITPMLIATLCYVWTAIDLLRDSSYAMSIVYGAYATANGALVWSTEKYRLVLQELARQFL